jgi:hypothetical protein
MLITNHQCQVAGHAPLSRPWQPGRPGSVALGHPRLGRPGARRSVQRLRVQSRTHWHRVTGSPWHGPPRLAAESHCTGRTRLGLGLRRVGETPRVSPDRPASESESDPGPGPSPIGRPYDSDSSKGHWHDPPTLLVRAAPGADSARPGESERRDARHITEISPGNIA